MFPVHYYILTTAFVGYLFKVAIATSSTILFFYIKIYKMYLFEME